MEKALQTMISNMPEKTGKSLEQWKEILVKENFSKHSEAMKFLKEKHGVSHGFANTIIILSKEEKTTDENLVTNQYKGKENLKPIYEELLKRIQQFGDDITITPKKDSVSCIRKRQFALIKPATKSRIDLGLKFEDKDLTERLQDSGPFGTMCTHRVIVSSLDEVDEELISWIKESYEKSA